MSRARPRSRDRAYESNVLLASPPPVHFLRVEMVVSQPRRRPNRTAAEPEANAVFKELARQTQEPRCKYLVTTDGRSRGTSTAR